MEYLWIAGLSVLCLAAVWLFFLFLPSLVSFLCCFGRRPRMPEEKRYEQSQYYRPVRRQIEDGKALLSRLSRKKVSLETRTAAGKPLVLRGTLFGEERGRAAVLMHGYGADPAFSLGVWAQYLYARGFMLLIPDQRASGESDGTYLTMGTGEGKDTALWTEYAAALPGVREVLLLGQSMGGTSALFASDLVKTEKLKAVVADCPFSSPAEQIRRVCRQRHLPAFLLVPETIRIAKRLTGEDFSRSCADSVRRARVPVFYISGDADTTVDIADVKALYAESPRGSRLYVTPGAEHAVAFSLAEKAAGAELDRFLNEHFEVNR